MEQYMVKKFLVLLLLIFSLSAIVIGCGRKGPPHPPDDPANQY